MTASPTIRSSACPCPASPPDLPALLARGPRGRERGRIHRAHGRRAGRGDRREGAESHRRLRGRARDGRGRVHSALGRLFRGGAADPAQARHRGDLGRGDLRPPGAQAPLGAARPTGSCPTAIISSKALTAGLFPMGAVILGPELADRLHRASEAVEEFPHGFTASGHPVGCGHRAEGHRDDPRGRGRRASADRGECTG